MMRYAPKTKPVTPSCGRDCPGRAPGCSAMCCSWMLYQSIREHIYQKQLAEKHAQELNFVARREIAHAGRKVRKGHCPVAAGRERRRLRFSVKIKYKESVP